MEGLMNEFWESTFKPELQNNPDAKVTLQLRGVNGGIMRSLSYMDTVEYKDKDKISQIYAAH
jgi:hypothetical protein